MIPEETADVGRKYGHGEALLASLGGLDPCEEVGGRPRSAPITVATSH